MPNSLNFRRYLEDVLVEQAVVLKTFPKLPIISRVFGGNPEAWFWNSELLVTRDAPEMLAVPGS